VGDRLANKTAVIVGAGQTVGATIGNGRATAILFAREGARVLLVDRDRDSVQETLELIERETPGVASTFVADIVDEDACRAIVAHALERFDRRIDVLHNNVGIGAGDGGPTSLDAHAWDRIMDTNLKAMWLTCKHVVPAMREQQAGAIVNISSIAAVAGVGNLTAYKISKAGVNALTQALAVTNARFSIRVNGIMPGLIDTPMAVDATARARNVSREAVADARARTVPLGHQGTAWDIAHAALFLASDDAAFITGVVLPVDGGQSAQVG
jgi:NAD(P)-dependent dehydrogenase (short-subunit alcohol dehydrogenase family)